MTHSLMPTIEGQVDSSMQVYEKEVLTDSLILGD